MRSRTSAIALAMLLAGAGAARGHGGGLDANGCHTEKKTGRYHCHRAPSRGSSSSGAPSTSSPSNASSAEQEANRESLEEAEHAALSATPRPVAPAAPLVSAAPPPPSVEYIASRGMNATAQELTITAQALLAALGHDPGPVNGVPGPKLTEAIRRFQASQRMRVDGAVAGPLLVALSQAVLDRSKAGH